MLKSKGKTDSQGKKDLIFLSLCAFHDLPQQN
jgi:hypothetical protein